MKLFFKVTLIIFFFGQIWICAQSGALYELEKIEFNGNAEISSDELKAVIYSEETPWWFYKFLNSFSSLGKEPVYFDSSFIQIDLRAMKAYYSNNGFFKTQFEYSYTVDTTDQTIILTYNIIENEPSNYGKITLFGLDELPVHILNRVYGEDAIDRSIPFKQVNVEKGIAHTIEILINRGYMLVNHDSTLIYIDSTKNLADINIYYHTGNRYQISDVKVVKKGSGADHVSERLLRELSNIERDEYYNLEKLRTSQSRLMRTGLFNSLIFDAVKKDTSNNYVPMLIEGNISNMNEFLPGVLINDESNAFKVGISANYSRKNFLGDARKLTLSNELAVVDILNFSFNKFFSTQNYTIDGYARISLKLEQPFLFQKPIYGSLENYFQTESKLGLSAKIYGVKAALEFEMPYFTYINQIKPYYNLEFYDFKARDIVSDNLLYSPNGFFRTSYLGLQLGSAKANNLYFPTAGSNQLLSLEAAISKGIINLEGFIFEEQDSAIIATPVSYSVDETALFYRFEYTSTYYLPLVMDNSSVFAIKNKLGYIQTFSGEKTLIPANRTFFAGGSNSVRGWRSRGLAPIDQIGYLDPTEFFDVLVFDDTTKSSVSSGGTFLFEGSFEFRKRFLESLGVTVFTDFGNVWNGYGEFRFDEIALAVGFGFRYYTSIAPFRIDFGFKLYDPYEKKFLWNNWDKTFFKNLEFHFGIGEAF